MHIVHNVHIGRVMIVQSNNILYVVSNIADIIAMDQIADAQTRTRSPGRGPGHRGWHARVRVASPALSQVRVTWAPGSPSQWQPEYLLSSGFKLTRKVRIRPGRSHGLLVICQSRRACQCKAESVPRTRRAWGLRVCGPSPSRHRRGRRPRFTGISAWASC